MASIFTRIINGEIPCYRVAENDRYMAFLDVRPLKPGHTLVVPKREVDYIFDLDEEALAGMMIFAQKVARAMKEVIECNRIGVAVIGLEVPHAHIHLVPITREGDMLLSNPRVSLSQQENERLAREIGANVRL
ncbi:MAG: HIT domain-containing protein [Bacteroidales bacterium]|jgi:histidine triad (HIT) family protein|nr:HIT domain-containing protein [Bacteroidales bacterium]